MAEIDVVVATLDEKLKEEGAEFFYTEGACNKFEIICSDLKTYLHSKKLLTWKNVLTKKYPKCKWYMVFLDVS